ncbi:MAG: PA2779 family protein [Thauera sp.]
MKRIQRLLAIVLSVSVLNVSALQTANAALVSTEEAARLASASQTESGHARLAAALARDDVRAELLRQGVDPTLAQERIAALTDAEATRLADQIDSAPAGGIIGAILLVFFVLLFTDILGLTKVFPFTRSIR